MEKINPRRIRSRTLQAKMAAWTIVMKLGGVRSFMTGEVRAIVVATHFRVGDCFEVFDRVMVRTAHKER